MLTERYERKSIGSGQSAQAPLYASGYFTWTPNASQPPVEPPVVTRAQPAPIPRNCFSIIGIRSSVIASPYGPLFAEFTAYASSKYGVGCWTRTWIMRGTFGLFQSLKTCGAATWVSRAAPVALASGGVSRQP